MRRGVLIVAVLALLLRLAVTFALPSRPFSDFRSYLVKAEALADRGNLEGMSAMHPPGYPAVLAVVFLLVPGVDRLLLAKLANCALGSVAILLGAAVAGRFWGARAAVAAAVGLALLPRQLLMPSLIASENLFTPLLFAFVWLVGESWRGENAVRRTAVTGAVVGALAMTRAVSYLVWAVWLAAAWAGGRPWRRVVREFALLLVVQHAVMLPWALSNYLYHGRFTFLTCSGGMGLFIGNNEHATGLWYPEWKQDLEALRPDIVGAENYEVNDAAQAEAVRWILVNPGRAAGLYFAKFGWIFRQDHLASDWTTKPEFWSGPAPGVAPDVAESARRYWLVRHRDLAKAADRTGAWVAVALGLLGAVLMVRKRGADDPRAGTARAVSLLGTIAYVPFVSALIAVNGRYRWPVEDLLVLLAALAVTAFFPRGSSSLGAGAEQRVRLQGVGPE